jgi:thioredoxin reductase
MAFSLAGDGLTIYTGGMQFDLDESAQKALEIAVARGAKLDKRQIKAFSRNIDGPGVRVHFQEGKDHLVRMVMSFPKSTPRAVSLIQSLGLETGPDGYVIAKTAMGATSLYGCFVAGDTSTAPKIVHAAQASGKSIEASVTIPFA